jgi:hypothetical protein
MRSSTTIWRLLRGKVTGNADLAGDVSLIVIHMVRISVGPAAGAASSLGNRSLHVLVKHEGNRELEGFANVPILPPSGAIQEAEGEDVFYTDLKH